MVSIAGGDNTAAPTIGEVTMANLKTEAKLEIQRGLPVKEKIAILKPEPINYFKEAWKQLAPVAGNIGFAVVADAVERISGWHFSPWVWNIIIGMVSFACVLLLISFIASIHRKKRINEIVTKMLIAANSTDGMDGNNVQLIDPDPEVVNAYIANGYKIITR